MRSELNDRRLRRVDLQLQQVVRIGFDEVRNEDWELIKDRLNRKQTQTTVIPAHRGDVVLKVTGDQLGTSAWVMVVCSLSPAVGKNQRARSPGDDAKQKYR